MLILFVYRFSNIVDADSTIKFSKATAFGMVSMEQGCSFLIGKILSPKSDLGRLRLLDKGI
jgi:hypothetical protein